MIVFETSKACVGFLSHKFHSEDKCCDSVSILVIDLREDTKSKSQTWQPK